MPATLEIAIFLVGFILFLMGIIGRVDAFNVKAGTDNKIARIALGIIGLLFMLMMVTSYSIKQSNEQTKETWDQLERMHKFQQQQRYR